MLAGKADGANRAGQFLTFKDLPHNDLLLTNWKEMGLNQTSFGDARFNTGAISELLV